MSMFSNYDQRLLDHVTKLHFIGCGGSGMFRELYNALLKGASWHQPDHYFLLLDFLPYCEARLRANRDYADKDAFARKCLLNAANAGQFSSDRTIAQYADEIWHISAE